MIRLLDYYSHSHKRKLIYLKKNPRFPQCYKYNGGKIYIFLVRVLVNAAMDRKEDGFLSIFFLFIIKRVLNDDFNNNTMDKIFFTTIQSELKLFLLSSNCPNGYVEIQKFIYNFYKAINFSLVLFFFKTVAFISSRDGRLNKITRLNCYAISCIH